MISQFEKPRGLFGKFLSFIMNISNVRMNNYIIKSIEPSEMNILEIGYGNGQTIIKLSKKCKMANCKMANIYGVDISPDMYELASNKIKNLKIESNVNLTVGDTSNLQYKDNFLDIIYTTDTCYFWNNPEQVLKEIYRTLKEGGQFINAYNQLYAKSISICKKESNKIYTNEELIKTATKVGFKVIKTKKIDFIQSIIIFNT